MNQSHDPSRVYLHKSLLRLFWAGRLLFTVILFAGLAPLPPRP